MVRGGQLIIAMTTKDRMKMRSAAQHHAARRRAPNLNLYMTKPEMRIPTAAERLWLRPPVMPTVAAFCRK